jgi:hypothetical protein
MEKPNLRIGIDINGVLRDTISKIELVYQKFMIDKTDGIEDEDDFEYKIIKPFDTTELLNHFTFKNEEQLFSFLYEEFPMEIFGHSPSTEYSTFNDLNNVYLNTREEFDLLLVSDEISKSKPATLFFLSKFGSLIEKVKFYSHVTLDSMWDEVDVLVTSNPQHLLNHPTNKSVIKYETPYNQHIDVDYTIKTIKELENKIKNFEVC